MNNEDLIADLKQFILATISQQTEELRQEFRQALGGVEKKIDDLSESVAEAMDTTNEQTQITLDNHEQRLTRLEHKPA